MGGGGGKHRGRIRVTRSPKLDDVRNEINVTPLVDVCLVLLIIFMVVTPMLARGKEVPLPRTRAPQEEQDNKQPIVAIDGDGQLYFDKDPVVDLPELKRRIEEAWEADEGVPRRVLVKADKDLFYDKVYPIIMAVHELGVPGVDLGTNELKDE
jgi:biopolymer transport protein TolR